MEQNIKNVFEIVLDLLRQGWKNNPDIARQLYFMRAKCMDAFSELGSTKSPFYKQIIQYTQEPYKMMLLDFGMKVCNFPADNTVEQVTENFNLVVDYLNMDKKLLRLEYDEEYVELIHHGQYHIQL